MKLVSTTKIRERLGLAQSAFWRIARARNLRPVARRGGECLWHPRQVRYLKPGRTGMPGQHDMARMRPKIERDRHIWEACGAS